MAHFLNKLKCCTKGHLINGSSIALQQCDQIWRKFASSKTWAIFLGFIYYFPQF